MCGEREEKGKAKFEGIPTAVKGGDGTRRVHAVKLLPTPSRCVSSQESKQTYFVFAEARL